MSTYTSRSRFDESRRFTGVYQQMGRVILDSDWNEEVRIRATDAARRSAGVADGALGDAFAIGPMFMFDPVVSLAGWSGTKGGTAILGTVVPEIALARREPASLPYVIRARGYTDIRRDLPNVLDLAAAKAPSIGVAPFAVSRLSLEVRIDLPPGPAPLNDPKLEIIGQQSAELFTLSSLAGGSWQTAAWMTLNVGAGQIAHLGQIKGFRLTDLPAQATVSIGGLQVKRANDDSGVIRGGDGTMAGAGVMFVDGVRACLPADIDFTSQPDYPMPPAPDRGGNGEQLYPALILSANLLGIDWSSAGTMTITSGGSSIQVDLTTLSTAGGSAAVDNLVDMISYASNGAVVCERFRDGIVLRSAAKGQAAQLSVSGTSSSTMITMFGAATVTGRGGDGYTPPQPAGVPPQIVSGVLNALESDLSQLNGLTLVLTSPSGQGTCTFANVTSLNDVATQIMAAASGVTAENIFSGGYKRLVLSPKPGHGFAITIDLQKSTAAALLGFSANASNYTVSASYFGASSPVLVAYLDLWEIPVTAREDAFITEPALDGMETASRMRLVQQVKTLFFGVDDPIVMPRPTGGGALTTSFAINDLRPLRYPTESFDACRDRCLDTASIATGTGYRGTENVHVRVQVLATPQGPAALWARDNGSTLLMLTEDAAAGATRLKVSPEDALRLRAGDFVVIEDRITRLQPEGGAIGGDPSNLHRAELRRLRAVDPASGAIELEADDATVGRAGKPLSVGGALSTDFRVDDQAAVRRWDGADLIEEGYRYNLPDGIDFAFSGDPLAYRPGDFWSFTARVHDPDGLAQGKVEALVEAPPHGPVHRCAPLLRAVMGTDGFTDLRRRFLPLHDVRDRLIELERGDGDHVPFTVVVGDGTTSFGDVDQDLAHGVTGDDALQTAIDRVGEDGGTIYIRAGSYTFRGPVMITSRSRLRILGDGKATVINVGGLGGAFFVDQSGADGAVIIQDLHIVDGAVVDVPNRIDSSAGPPDPQLTANDLLANNGTPLVVSQLIQSFPNTGTPPRAVDVIKAAYTRLRWLLQNANAGASALSTLLAQLPRGAVTISDSSVALLGCSIVGPTNAPPEASAVFITGASDAVKVHRCALGTNTGIAALPLASYFSDAFLATHPGAGLSVTDLQIDHNDIVALSTGSRGVHGVRLVDGAFDAVAIRHNHVERFVVGVEVGDHAELHGNDTGKRFLIADNRVRDCSVVGIQIAADGVDAVRNEVACPHANVLATDGLFQAGIQITGQRVRVHGSWISMESGETRMYGAYAGIAVGDIVEDGTSPARPVFDVEITDNRIEGSPAVQGYGAVMTGVLIGGPQAVYDVRVRGNELRNLGDAGVRVLGTGVAVGRIRIEDNRIDQVCLANTFHDNSGYGELMMLTPPGVTLNWGTTDHSDPSSVVAFLYSPGVDAALITPLIDAALRAVEVATLRGAVALCRAESVDVRGNSINGVGYTSSNPTSNLDFAKEVRVAGVAVVGGSEVVVEDNHVEDVRAPFSGLADSNPTTSGTSPVDAIETALEVIPDSAAGQIVQATLHDMAAGLNLKLLGLVGILKFPLSTIDEGVRAAQVVANNQAIEGSLCEVDTLIEHLMAANLGNIATSLKNAGDQVRANTHNIVVARTGYSARLYTSIDITRHLVAHAAYATTTDERSRYAWNAIQNLAGTLVPITADLPEVYDFSAGISYELQQIQANFNTLFADVPNCDLKTGFTTTLNTVTAAGHTPTPDDARLVLYALSLLAAYRDEMVRYSGFNGAAALGYRSDVIASLAKTVRDKVTSLPGDFTTWVNSTANPKPKSPIEVLRPSVRSLCHVLSDAGSDLAAYVAADFMFIDRVIPVLTTDAAGTITHMQAVLDRVIAWASDQLTVKPTTDGAYADAAVRLGSARAQYAIIQAALQNIDTAIKHIATLPDPSILPPYTLPYSAEVFGGIGIGNELFQLFGVVRDDPELTLAAFEAVTAAARALPPTNEPFATAMENVGAIFARMLVTASEIIAASAGVSGDDANPSEITERRIAGLGALLLALRGATPFGGATWQTPMDVLKANVILAMAETSAGSVATDAASKTIAAARAAVVGTSPDPSSVRAQLSKLAEIVDGLGTSAAGMFATPEVTAAATLVRAAKLALNPTALDADVIKSVKDYLEQRRAEISSSIVDRIKARTDIADVRADLRDALLRIAISESTSATALTEPEFEAPESADGMLAVAVDERLSIAHNTIESALTGVTILSAAGHVLACTSSSSSDNLLVEVIGNRLRGCSISALEVMPRNSGEVMVVVEGNHAVGCADLGASASALNRGSATNALQVPATQAVARFAGTGDLLLHGNVFQGNGHGQPAALLHEILVDWRGDLVVRGNTVRHNGGGSGGAALLVLTELLDANLSNRVALIGKLSRSPALAVEPAPAQSKRLSPATRSPWRATSLTVGTLTPKVTFSSAHYVTRASKRTRVTTIKDFLIREKVTFRPIRPAPPIARSSVQLEGNHVQATGPALLVLGKSGGDIVSATIVGNELRSFGGTGAVYVRHTDATVFNGNECESLSAVNVVVVRPQDAPVAICGNVILGAQPVAQVSRAINAARVDVRRLSTTQRSRACSLVVVGGTHVVSVGNATTAGALVLGADEKTEINN